MSSISKRSNHRRRFRPALEALEDRSVPASGWVSWNDWFPGPEGVAPAAPGAGDVINFRLAHNTFDDVYHNYLRLDVDESNKIIDVVFMPSQPLFTSGEVLWGLYGQLWSLDPGEWTLRGPQSSINFTVTGEPVPWLEIDDVSVAEGDSGTTDAVFTVSLSVPSTQTVTVEFDTYDYDATAGEDYVPVSGSLSFAPGETTKTITVPVNGDTTDDYYKYFWINLVNPTNARLGPNANQDNGWGMIRDDDSSLEIYAYYLPFEGNSGTRFFDFAVSMNGPCDETVSVNFETADGSAQVVDNDYLPTAGVLIFAPGDETKYIGIEVNGDTRYEANETFFVRLSNPINAPLVNSQAQGTIYNDDTPPPPPSVRINDTSTAEGHTGTTSAVFTVTLSAVSDQAVTVNFATADGTATAGSDYLPVSGALTFAPGETAKTIAVPVNGDRLSEPSESFLVNLTGATNAPIADAQALGSIVDDEPRISISDVTMAEGKKGQTTLFTFTVTLSAAYDQPVTMSYRTVNGTATTSNNDYVAKTGTLTFNPGETTKTITIEVKGDSKREASESFYLDLFGLSANAMFTKNRGLGTIINDD